MLQVPPTPEGVGKILLLLEMARQIIQTIQNEEQPVIFRQIYVVEETIHYTSGILLMEVTCKTDYSAC